MAQPSQNVLSQLVDVRSNVPDRDSEDLAAFCDILLESIKVDGKLIASTECALVAARQRLLLVSAEGSSDEGGTANDLATLRKLVLLRVEMLYHGGNPEGDGWVQLREAFWLAASGPFLRAGLRLGLCDDH